MECEKRKQTMVEIRMWIKKQNDKMNLKGSKKSSVLEFLENILKVVQEGVKTV